MAEETKESSLAEQLIADQTDEAFEERRDPDEVEYESGLLESGSERPDDSSETTQPDAEPSESETPAEPISPDESGSDALDGSGASPAGFSPETSGDEIPDVFAIADKLGIGESLRGKYADPDAAMHGLVHAYQKIGERDDDANYGRQYRQYQPAFEQYLQQQNTPPAPQTDQAEETGPPQYDPRILNYLESDGQGMLFAKPDAPPGVVTAERLAQAQAYVDYASNQRKQFETFDPQKIQQEAEQRAEQIVEERFYQQQQVQMAQQIVAQRTQEDWFFAKDNSGNVVRDPQTGHEVMSPQGHAYSQYIQYAHDRLGISDPQAMDEFARAKVLETIYSAGQRQPAPQTPPQQAAPQINPGAVHRRTAPNGTPPDIDSEQPRSLKDALMQSNKNAAANGETVYRDFTE